MSSPEHQTFNPETQGTEMLSLSEELKSRDMFCLHGVSLDDVGMNSIMPRDTSMEERFRVAIEERPALSAVVHTDTATTSKVALWSSVGVVIGEGKIQAASSRDMSSVMREDGSRQTPDHTHDDMRQALDRIAENDAKYGEHTPSNEVVVQNPSVSGLYFKDTVGLMPYQINRNHVSSDPGTVPRIIRELGRQFNLPVYAVRTSGMYQVGHYDNETGKYSIGADSTRRMHSEDVLVPKADKSGQMSGRIAVSSVIET